MEVREKDVFKKSYNSPISKESYLHKKTILLGIL